jgi:predicted nucleic acid-binding protein
MAGLVIADASPLIALARVDGLRWLADLFGVVRVPAPVAAEVLTGGFQATEAAIREAIAAERLLVVTSIPLDPELPDLDEGEAACLRLALAGAEPSLVLIDERAGRAVALELGLQVAGTAAVIGMARRRGLIPSARQVFRDLHASDFRIAPAVIQAVLERCGEQNPG